MQVAGRQNQACLRDQRSHFLLQFRSQQWISVTAKDQRGTGDLWKDRALIDVEQGLQEVDDAPALVLLTSCQSKQGLQDRTQPVDPARPAIGLDRGVPAQLPPLFG